MPGGCRRNGVVAFAKCGLPEPRAHEPGLQPRSDMQNNPVFSLAAEGEGPPIPWLVAHRPTALLACASQPSVMIVAGAIAGAAGKTATAPLDRLKIILQVKGSMLQGAIKEAAIKGNFVRAFLEIGRQEGFFSYWKGNLPQVMRVIPYSAIQLCSYDVFKHQLSFGADEPTVPMRMLAGAAAGTLSTVVTYPLDTLRTRLALDPALTGVRPAAMALLRESGPAAFFRGVGPAALGIAPYMALELTAYDLMPKEMPSFLRGFTAALMATSVCYPLDTIRRRIQIRSTAALPFMHVLKTALETEGIGGLYRGFIPNCVKNLPNKGAVPDWNLAAAAVDLGMQPAWG